MNARIANQILPKYHKVAKKRHDLLCIDLSRDPELSDIGFEAIDLCVIEIEALVASSACIARDVLHGVIHHNEALQKIHSQAPDLNHNSIDIILERANYYAQR